VFLPNIDILSFEIFVSLDINNLLVLNVHEEVIFISENLPPATVGAPNLETI
jgi:hypothetical protein